MNRSDVTADQTGLEHRPLRRVRDEVRDGVAVAVTSVTASLVLVLMATLLMRLAG